MSQQWLFATWLSEHERQIPGEQCGGPRGTSLAQPLGNVALDDFDIYNEARWRDIGVAKSFLRTIGSDGILEIEFVGANALISVIEILAS